MTRDHLVKIASRFGRPMATMVALGTALLVVAGPGCGDEGIGDPCTPEQEYAADFLGFDKKEVNIESKSFQCRTRLCLVNHFQGRVSCPYGQQAQGDAPSGAQKGCVIPGSAQAISGKACADGKACETDDDCAGSGPCAYTDAKNKAAVKPWCLERTADRAVYCSCRCADLNGQKPSDQTFCECPDNYVCSRLVTSIGQGNEGLTGSYCIKKGTEYEATTQTTCTTGQCTAGDPNSEKACGKTP